MLCAKIFFLQQNCFEWIRTTKKSGHKVLCCPEDVSVAILAQGSSAKRAQVPLMVQTFIGHFPRE
eukprot:8477773-Karenia_brevis.AAC.1